MAKRRHVHANLVSAPGFYLHFEQGELAVGRIDFSRDRIVRNGVAAAEAARRHTSALLRVAADGVLNGAALTFGPAMNERDISLVHLAPAELFGQLPVRLIVLGNDHQSAGGAIEAMHNSGAQFAANLGKLLEVVQQGIDQRCLVARVVGCARARVYHHAGGLVDNGEVVVLIDDVERNFLRNGAQRRTLRWARDCNPLIALEAQRGFGASVVDEDFAGFDELLNAGAADLGDLRGQVLVETLRGIVGGDGQVERKRRHSMVVANFYL